MKYPLHNNETGSFQELAHSSDVKFGQLSILTIEPQCKRGGHYHTRKEEWFCCIHGKCKLELVNIKDGTKKVLFLSDAYREYVLIKPYESHTVTNLGSKVECEILIIISEEYNPEDPDTIKYMEE